jgi:hypothetical protein
MMYGFAFLKLLGGQKNGGLVLQITRHDTPVNGTALDELKAL